MKHAILGVGAIGGVIATAMASLGEEVIAVVRPEKLASHPPQLTLDRPTGTLNAPAAKVAYLTEPVDVLWIATKSYQLDAALQAVQSRPRLVVPLLNGVDHVAALRSRFGAKRVVPATIAVEAEMLAPGHFIQRSPFLRLNLSSSGEPPLGELVARLGEIGFTWKFIANEQTLLWSKLCFLAPFALATTASGKNKGEIFADSHWKHQLFAAIDETCAVANASGADVDPDKLRDTSDALPPTMRSSMAKDLAAQRPLEIDAIAGPILRGGERHSIDVSVTRNLVASIQALADGKLPQQPGV